MFVWVDVDVVVLCPDGMPVPLTACLSRQFFQNASRKKNWFRSFHPIESEHLFVDSVTDSSVHLRPGYARPGAFSFVLDLWLICLLLCSWLFAAGGPGGHSLGESAAASCVRRRGVSFDGAQLGAGQPGLSPVVRGHPGERHRRGGTVLPFSVA